MRKLISAVSIAVAALVVAAPAALSAQAAKVAVPANAQWSQIPVKKVPLQAARGVKRVLPRAKITAAQRTGTGRTAFYKLSVTNTNKKKTKTKSQIIVTADGKIVQ